MSPTEGLVWVFGYGSLVWKVGFEFEQRLVGYIAGYKRRFWWWSLDHRGVPGAPGLVVTLVPTGREADKVWGVAYGVRRDVWEDRVRSHLDHREKGGYSRKEVIFHPKDKDKASHMVTLYIGLTTNEQWAGERSDEETIKIILERTGPSGANKDYLYNLCKAMRDIDPKDEYLYDLESKVANADKDRQNR